MSISPSGASGNIVPKGYKTGQLQQYGPEQAELFKRLFSHVGPESQLSKLAMGDESAFAPMEERAMRDFKAFQGQLGTRFSGMGTGGKRSGGFQNLATQGAQDFASMLKEQREGLKRQALNDLMGISNQLLGQRPYEQFMLKKRTGFWKNLFGSGSEHAGDIANAGIKLYESYQNNKNSNPSSSGQGQRDFNEPRSPYNEPGFQGGYPMAGDLSSISTPGASYGFNF